MQFSALVALSLVLAGAAVAAPTPAAQLPAPAVIPAAWQQQGTTAPGKTVTFTMSLKGANADALEGKMLEIAKSKGPWLTADELAAYTTPSADAVAAVKAALASAGVPAGAISFGKNNGSVTVKTDAATTSKLFGGAKLYDFTYKGQTHAKAKSLTLPSSLVGIVRNVAPLTSFPTINASPKRGPKPAPAPAHNTTVVPLAQPSSCDPSGITPQCLRDLFGTSSYTPSPVSGQTDLTVLGFIGQYVSQSDLTGFLQQYRSDAAGYQIPISSTQGSNDGSNPGVEAMLDVETAVGVAYPLAVDFLYYGGQNGDIFGQGLQYVLDNVSPLPGIVTASYGSTEQSTSASDADALCSAAQQLTAQGTTVLFASGDNGVDSVQSSSAPSCSSGFVPTYPSGCQYVLSVGGTQGFSPEAAVDPSQPGGFWSGGGFSTIWSRPSYQDSAVSNYLNTIGSASQGEYNANGRGFPDVSTQAANYIIEASGQVETVSGTSAAAPTFAALLALVNDKLRAEGKGRIGWAHPTLYANPSALTDITSGQNEGCPDTSDGFATAAGWDPVTGLGSATNAFAALVSAFGG